MKILGRLVLALWLSINFCSCDKKETDAQFTCSYNILYQTVGITFKGFSSSELYDVVVNTYSANGLFDNLLSSDTADYSGATFEGDLAYLQQGYNKMGLYKLIGGKDYEFKILATGQTYRISNIREGAPSYRWTQDTPCSMGASQVRIAANRLDVNGQEAATFYLSANVFLVSLTR